MAIDLSQNEIALTQHPETSKLWMELGNSFEPPTRVNIALWSLEAGVPIDVMRRYQVVVVSW